MFCFWYMFIYMEKYYNVLLPQVYFSVIFAHHRKQIEAILHKHDESGVFR